MRCNFGKEPLSNLEKKVFLCKFIEDGLQSWSHNVYLQVVVKNYFLFIYE